MRFHLRDNTVLRRCARWGMLPALAVGLAACSPDLTETSQVFISPDKFYQNDTQAQIAVNAVYQPLMDWNGWRQPAQHSIMCDEDELGCESWLGGGLSGSGLASQWFGNSNSVWQGDYTIINRANQVLSYVGNSSGVSDEGKNHALGMAKFARAYAYFDLVRRFGAVPLRTVMYTPDAQLGAQARAPVDSIWNQIVADLRDAATMLPTDFDASNGSGLPRVASANGLLAKVYLHMAGAEASTAMQAKQSEYLDSASYFAQQVMADASTGLEPKYMDLFNTATQNGSREILFAVQGNRGNGSNIPPFLSPAGDCTLVGGCGAAGPGFVTIRPDFVASFDPADLRWEKNVAFPLVWQSNPASQSVCTAAACGALQNNTVTVIHKDSFDILEARGLAVRDSSVQGDGWVEGCEINRLYPGFYAVHLQDSQGVMQPSVVAIPEAYFTLKYIDKGNNGDQYGNANNFIILRYADVLLVLAEAEGLKTGQTGVAMQALHLIRQRAGLPDMAAGLGQTAFVDSVRLERRHELYAEFQRRFDMIREGVYLSATEGMNKPVETAHNGTQVCRPRAQYQLLQPIPSGELAANPLIQQNPGW